MAQHEGLASLKIDRSERRRGTALPWILLAVVLVGVVGYGAWTRIAAARVPEVRTVAVREVRLQQGSTVLNASGYVTARRQATVSSKVTGRVVEVLIEEGMRVRRGQLMARLDDSNARVNLGLAEAQVTAGQSLLAETQVRLRKAELDLERLVELHGRRIASQAELDGAQAEVDSLAARIEQQAQEVNVAERRVALWQQEIADREIRAPFDGVVVMKNAQPGEMISPMSAGGFTRTGIGTIVDMESLEIEVDVNESYINRVEPGQPVEALLDAYPDWSIGAHVIAIVPTADRARATVRVRIGFDGLDPRVLPDMGIKVAFREAGDASRERVALSIPREGLREIDGRDVVLVLSGAGIVEQREVNIEEVGPETAFVAGDVRVGDRVIVEGAELLQPGDSAREVSR